MEKKQSIDTIDKHIGKKMRELRLASGLSCRELGNKIGVAHQQYQKYETGTDSISAGRLMLAAKVFRKPIEYFYSNVKKQPVESRTTHQRMCLEISRNFMHIKKPKYQNAINTLVKILSTTK